MKKSEFNKIMKDSFGDKVINVPSEELTLESVKIKQLEKDNKNLLNAIRSLEIDNKMKADEVSSLHDHIKTLNEIHKDVYSINDRKENELAWWRIYGEYVSNIDNNTDQEAIEYSDANNLNK